MENAKDGCINLLRDYSRHQNIYFTSRGNKAILASLRIFKSMGGKRLLIPDQGGWITYAQYAKRLKLSPIVLKTDYGLINKEALNEAVKNADGIIYSNPAGYYAEQPVRDIYGICKDNGVMVILDASGCIGSGFYKGNHADIIVGSFGRWKPVNLEYGGFISVNDGLSREDIKQLETLDFDERYYPQLLAKLKGAKKRYELLESAVKRIKGDLAAFDILHREKRGINVILRFSDEAEKDGIISYCEKNKYQFVMCPRMIRVMENAISIEVKRIG